MRRSPVSRAVGAVTGTLSLRGGVADAPPAPKVQIKKPGTSYLPTRTLPRLEDGTIVVNYVGPYNPASVRVFLDAEYDLKYIRLLRAPNDQMKLYAEIKPNMDFNRLQTLLGAIRSLSLIGQIKSADEA